MTHALWVGLMDAFFLCLLLTLVPGGFSQAMQQPGRDCSRVCSMGAFPAWFCFSRLRLSSSCWSSSSWAFPESCEHLNCIFAGIQQTPAF